MKPELMDGAPPGAVAACHPSGWIQQHICTRGFKKTDLCPLNKDIFRDHDFSIFALESEVVEEVPVEGVFLQNATKPPSTVVLPTDISPLPTLHKKQGTKGRPSRQGTAALITGSPYMKKLKETKCNTSKHSAKQLAKRKKFITEKTTSTKQTASKKSICPDSTDSESGLDDP
ncbi:hypothetical protein PR048_004036 [Dryococelus australis]|uniref:Uncharacterized protein n=1 Tax=Dryococelus australis TaxID=614101 RepID=A0ABQ9I4C0_9NEOP|nr:hypothetical protein PR048_004036 [Dryococelus australis]